MTFQDYRESVRSKSRLDEVVREHGVQLTPARMGRCPFHEEKTPSFSVHRSNRFFHCFGCGAGGDVFRFVELSKRLDFRAAIDLLARRAGLPTFNELRQDKETFTREQEIAQAIEFCASWYRSQLWDPIGAPALQYLQDRGITEGTVERMLLGWAPSDRDLPDGVNLTILDHLGIMVSPKNAMTWVSPVVHRFRSRVVFPSTHQGRVSFLSGRLVGEMEGPKYLHLKNREAPLYNRDVLEDSDWVLVVEGPMDALTGHQWQFPTVGLQGGFRPSAVSALRQAKRVVLCLDMDPAGQQAAMRLATGLVGGPDIQLMDLPEGKDPNDFAQMGGTREEFERRLHAAVHPVEWWVRHLEDTPVSTKTLAPLIKYLSVLEPLTAGLLIDRTVTPRLRLSYPVMKGLTQAVADARQENLTKCPACYTLLRGGGA